LRTVDEGKEKILCVMSQVAALLEIIYLHFQLQRRSLLDVNIESSLLPPTGGGGNLRPKISSPEDERATIVEAGSKTCNGNHILNVWIRLTDIVVSNVYKCYEGN
jgi:hypothetical protein